ncbi:MAG: hypothetical protein U0Q15_02200 [Kineosporiaceae bacterium]
MTRRHEVAGQQGVRAARWRRYRLRLAGVVASVLGLLVGGTLTADPSHAATVCSTTKYATWGAAQICKNGSSVTVKTLDRVEDGYCVNMWVGVRWGDGTKWGQYWVTKNCAKNTWQTATVSMSAAGRPLYACNATLFRGEYSIYSNYLPVWRETEGMPIPDYCVPLWY